MIGGGGYKDLEHRGGSRRTGRFVVAAVVIVSAVIVGISIGIAEKASKNTNATTRKQDPQDIVSSQNATNDEVKDTDDNFVTETQLIHASASIINDPYSEFATALATTNTLMVVGARNAKVNNIRTGTVFVYKKITLITPWTFSQEIFDTNAISEDSAGLQFGAAVGVSSSLIVIGAPGGNVKGSNSGTVHIYMSTERDEWALKQTIVAPDGSPSDAFGTSVAVDDNIIAVGAPGARKVYIFKHDFEAKLWSLSETLESPNSEVEFGKTIVLKEGTLVIGAPVHKYPGYLRGSGDNTASTQNRVGTVYIYRRRPNDFFALKDKLDGDKGMKDDGFAESIASDGDSIAVGAPIANASYIFEGNPDILWSSAIRLRSPNLQDNSFGTNVAIHGDIIAITSQPNPDAYTLFFVKGCDGWSLRRRLQPSNESAVESFGSTVALTDGTVFVGSSVPGGIFVFNVPIAIEPSCELVSNLEQEP